MLVEEEMKMLAGIKLEAANGDFGLKAVRATCLPFARLHRFIFTDFVLVLMWKCPFLLPSTQGHRDPLHLTQVLQHWGKYSLLCSCWVGYSFGQVRVEISKGRKLKSNNHQNKPEVESRMPPHAGRLNPETDCMALQPHTGSALGALARWTSGLPFLPMQCRYGSSHFRQFGPWWFLFS